MKIGFRLAQALSIPLLLIAATGQTAATEPPVADQLAITKASYRVVPKEYRLDGVVEAINRTTVSAQTSGQVEEILYDVDDFVEKGEIIVRLRDTEHRARLAQAAAELRSASAQLEQAREDYARVKGLYEQQNVSESAMDRAEAELKSAEARLDSAQANLEQAQEQLAYTQIRAPYSGIVTRRHVELGEIASPGTPVMSGVSLEELRVIIDVPQSLIPAVRELGEIRVYLPSGEVAQPDRITVFPFADLGSNTFKVRADLSTETEELFPGMFVKTGIVTGKEQELTVPKEAVVYRSEVTAVYVVDPDGDIRLRQIRTGPTLDDELVVLSGLTEGEQVALDPIAAGVALKAQAQSRVEGGEPHDG
ncbi:MAG: efflux RND transporter periplasmic adaptor subunit [Gammaproteobacteria bacterium]|jgi:RND family efflux transporter MFP subunit|nr:efflux RND transporter periplasmic adaptor subunit [Gammaproteobacteria bacterium]